MSRHAAHPITWLDAWDPAEGARRATATFTERLGGAPDGVWSAPGRVNLIGEHTDYNGGLCLPIDLPHRTYVALRHDVGDGADATLVRLASAQERGAGVWSSRWPTSCPAGSRAGPPTRPASRGRSPRTATGSPGSTPPSTRACRTAPACPRRPRWSARSPSRSTTSSGSASPVDDAGRARLAEACIRAENEVAGAPTGGMDQSSSLRAQPGHALLLDTRDGAVRHVPFDLAAAGLALLVVDTRAEHQLADGQYAARRTACEVAARQLGVGTLREVSPDGLDDALARLTDADLPAEVTRRRVRHVVTEIARVQEFVALLDAGRVRDVGPVMDASHASLRDDYEVSAPELDVVVEAARAAGALGARMTGGGFGGSAIALVEVGAIDAVASAVARAFDDAGFRPPAFLVAEASGPASRTA